MRLGTATSPAPQTTRPPGSRHRPPGRGPVTTPALLSPTVELQLHFQRGQTLTEKLQSQTRVEDPPPSPWTLRCGQGSTCFTTWAVHTCLHTHTSVCACVSAHAHVCPGLPFAQSGSNSGFVCCSLVASAGVQVENHSRASRHQGLAHPLVMSSTWTHKLHGDTSSAWTHELHVDRELHVDTRPPEDTRAPRDMSPSSTRLPLPLHLPGMPLPCSNMLSAGGPPDTWRRQAHGMGWGGHCTQQNRTSATCHRLVTSRTDPERRCRAQRVGC